MFFKKLFSNPQLAAAHATIEALNAALVDGVLAYMYLAACELENAQEIPRSRFTTYTHRLGGADDVTVVWFSDETDMIALTVGPAIDPRPLRSGLLELGCITHHSDTLQSGRTMCFYARTVIEAFEKRPSYKRTAAALIAKFG